MQQGIHLLILALYIISLTFLGSIVVKKWFSGMPVLLAFVGSMIVGIGIGVPTTYILASLLRQTGESILWSTVLFIAVVFILSRFVKIKKSNSTSVLTFGDVLIVLFSVLFSSWLMMKTFRAGTGGTLFVGSNNVFDFGHSLGIVRSFSWGNNIPFMSPFQSGLPFFYHFLFYFFVALWEYFGVPIVWAMNIPSIVSFASLLIIVYFLPQVFLKQTKLAGWVAVLLTITHSTLTFWYFIPQKGFNFAFFHTTWRLPAYPFAGPYDGSVISVFMTLNNYVNQRHLAFSIALGLFLIMCLLKLSDDKRLTNFNGAVLGVLTGGMFFWNIPVSALVGAIIVLLMLLRRRWRESVTFSVCALGTVVMSVLPFVSVWKSVWSLGLSLQGTGRLPQWNIFQYLWENLGILPFVAVAGFFVIPKQRRGVIAPFFLFFAALCLYAAYGKHGFDQKFLSVLIIGVNISAACGIVWLLRRKRVGFRLLALALLFTLTVSGAIDLMVVKNEFAYPLVDKDTAAVISWIKKNTQRDAIFVSYSDIIDPVVLAGRTNYFGFYGNVGWVDRSPVVSRVYQGDISAAKASNISYILIPRWKKNDFPYAVDEKLLTATYETVYEDTKYLILRIDAK